MQRRLKAFLLREREAGSRGVGIPLQDAPPWGGVGWGRVGCVGVASTCRGQAR
jgi:hypothetical protein